MHPNNTTPAADRGIGSVSVEWRVSEALILFAIRLNRNFPEI